jgi:hypothetical protein
MSKWRNRYKLHPLASVFPRLPEDELRDLGEDIKMHGARVPIAITSKPIPDADGAVQVGRVEQMVVDGASRLDAMELVGVEVIDKDGHLNPKLDGKPVEGFEVVEVEAEDVAAYVISTNITRRHLTKSQQADLIVAVRQEATKLTQVESVSEAQAEKHKGGRGKKNPIKEAVLADGKAHDISAGTMQRALAEAEKPKGVVGDEDALAKEGKEIVEEAKKRKPKKPKPPKTEAGGTVTIKMGIAAAREHYVSELAKIPESKRPEEADRLTRLVVEVLDGQS